MPPTVPGGGPSHNWGLPLGSAPRRRSGAVEADQTPLHGPAAELVAARELELAEHRAHVRLDRLDRDAEALRDLLVHVAAGYVPEHLALARGELVQLGVLGTRR